MNDIVILHRNHSFWSVQLNNMKYSKDHVVNLLNGKNSWENEKATNRETERWPALNGTHIFSSGGWLLLLLLWLLSSFTIHLVAIIINIHTSRKRDTKNHNHPCARSEHVKEKKRNAAWKLGPWINDNDNIMRWNKICYRHLKWKLSVLSL